MRNVVRETSLRVDVIMSFAATIHTKDEVVDRETFRARALRIAAGLQNLGANCGDCVALLLKNDFRHFLRRQWPPSTLGLMRFR